MADPKRQVSFFIPKDLYKEISMKAIDEDTSKTELIIKALKEYLKRK